MDPCLSYQNDVRRRPLMSRHVAVIGAGPSGLIAAHELRREGHKVVVFERQDKVGGTWIYTPKTESDPLGLDPHRAMVHSSLYLSLRTNLPREVMGFRVYPFVVNESKDRDPRRFPGHREVLMYLRDFANEFGIVELVRFETEVVYASMVEGDKWKVRSKKRGQGVEVDEIYDAVVVCVGHYKEPRIAQIPGIDAWPGKQMHSHNYRIPEPFRDQVVVLIGASVSATDISRDIAAVAKEVHVASRSVAGGTTTGKQPGYDNMWQHPMIKRVHQDGSVVFQDGNVVLADIILHCTGYRYDFPFLESNGTVTVDDNRVGPLYKHIFPPALAPSLSFVGLPWKAANFPIFEFQSKWIAGILSNRITLLSVGEMMEDVKKFYSKLEISGMPKRYTHNLGDSQLEYANWLAVQSGCPVFEEWRKEMYYATNKSRILRPETFRDNWEDNNLILQAHQDFIKYSPNEISNGKASAL